MGLLKRLFGKPKDHGEQRLRTPEEATSFFEASAALSDVQQPAPSVLLPALHFGLRRRPWNTTSKGGTPIIGSAYRILEDETSLWVDATDSRLSEAGISVFRASGVRYSGEALQQPQFAPGEPLRLIPDAQNQYDHHAVGVWDATATVRVGWVPRAEAAELCEALLSGEELGAVALSQFRDLAGARISLQVLVAPRYVMDKLTANMRPFSER
jgi:hypothetical protein